MASSPLPPPPSLAARASGVWPWPAGGASAAPFTPSPDARTPHVPLSEAVRSYRVVTLPNELRALLVHDPKADKAAAALSVQVGHLSDPRALPGLSHAVEHMLFLGTKEFPHEGEYNAFLKAHGGASNASTSAEATTYHFTVHHAHLREALARFGSFFVSPLFTESATDRELNAVDSENARNLSLDGRRELQVSKHLSAPGSVYSKFGTGNLQTLKHAPAAAGIDVRSEMLAHYARYYSANLMTLAVIGRESLDELESLINGGPAGGSSGASATAGADGASSTGVGAGAGAGADAASGGAAAAATAPGVSAPDFKAVVNKSLPVPLHDGAPPERHLHPYQRAQLGRSVFITPVKDVRKLGISWPIPSPAVPDYARVGGLLSFLFGHEGEGSLFSLLKARGLATSLSAGSTGYRHFSSMEIDVSLTPLGLERADEVVRLALQYALLLRGKDDAYWAAVHAELAQTAANAVRFRAQHEPLGTVTGAVSALQRLPNVDVLVGDYLRTTLDLPAIRAALRCCCAPRHTLVMLTAKAFGEQAGRARLAAAHGERLRSHEEPYYPSLTYLTAPFSDAQLALFGAGAAADADAGPPDPVAYPNEWDLRAAELPLCDELAVPAPNSFIPSDFALRPVPADGAAPSPAALTLAPHALDLPASLGLALVGRSVAAPAKFREPTLIALGAPPAAASPLWARAAAGEAPAAAAAARLRDLFVAGVTSSAAAAAAGAAAASLRVEGGLPTRIFVAQDVTFRFPKAFLRARVRLPRHKRLLSQGGSRLKAMAPLFIDVLHDTLVETTYVASLAGLQCNLDVDVDDSALGIVVTGYSHKHAALLARSLDGLAVLAEAPDAVLEPIFARKLEARRRALASWSKAQPRDRAVTSLSELVSHPAQSYESWLADLEGATLADLRAFARGLFDSQAEEDGGEELGASVDMLLYGNVLPEDALSAGRLISLTLGRAGARRPRAEFATLAAQAAAAQAAAAHAAHATHAGLPDDLFCEPLGLLLAPGGPGAVLTRQHPSAEERNSAVHCVFQLGAATPRTRAVARLLDMLVSQPAFDTLRTKEQLGYIVGAGSTLVAHGAVAALYVSVQSSNASVAHVEARIEAFLAAFRAQLAAMPETVVAERAQVLSDRLLESDKTQGAECSRLWDGVADDSLDWHGAETRAACIRELRQADLLAVWDACVMPGGALRRRLLSRVYAQVGGPAGAAAASAAAVAAEAPAAGGAAGEKVPAAVLHDGGPSAPPPSAGAAEVDEARILEWKAAQAQKAGARWLPSAGKLAAWFG